MAPCTRLVSRSGRTTGPIVVMDPLDYCRRARVQFCRLCLPSIIPEFTTLCKEPTRGLGARYEFYSCEGLSRYSRTSADNAATPQILRASLDCLPRALESKIFTSGNAKRTGNENHPHSRPCGPRLLLSLYIDTGRGSLQHSIPPASGRKRGFAVGQDARYTLLIRAPSACSLVSIRSYPRSIWLIF